MNCDWTTDRLADYMLDELPESEAVLIQEHLHICPACMRTYRDLKGTGMLLGAVTSMRSVPATEDFRENVRAQAVVELRNIVASLPPEKRLRLEARRAARLSRALTKTPSAPPPSIFTKGLAILTAACLAAVAVVLLYPKTRNTTDLNQPLAVLSQTVGRVDEFFQKANEPHTQTASGKTVLNGDTFLTSDIGRARFDLSGGGALYAGGLTRLTFRAPQQPSQRVTFVLESGEVGLQLPAPDIHDGVDHTAALEARWELRTEAATFVVEPGAHVYLTSSKSGRDYEAELLVVSGTVRAQDRVGKTLVNVVRGQRAKFKAGELNGRPQDFSPPRVPPWRADLVSDTDLAGLLGVKGKVVRQKDGTLAAELFYSRQPGSAGLDDWQSELSPAPFRVAANGTLTLQSGARVRHPLPFSGPVTFDIQLSREGPREANFAFGLLDASDCGVVVDVTKTANLQIRDKGRNARSNTVPARSNKNGNEFLRLEIIREASGYSAQLVTAAGKSKVLPLSKVKNDDGANLWIQALGDAMLFDEIKISGTLSMDWLRDRLSLPQATP